MMDGNNLEPRRGPFRLSLVVPIFNEEAALEPFFDRVVATAEHTTSDYEIVCVNDGSVNGTLAKLIMARADNSRIKIIDLSRNFGKEAALTAGLEYATGDALIPLDADLQDPAGVDPSVGRQVEGGLRYGSGCAAGSEQRFLH